VHRIGQPDEVTVVRLVIHGTVEEKMLELQERKRRNAVLLLDDEAHGDEQAARQLRMQDLALCFA
jgi:SNF2 family DNA or RNA helicase